MKLKMKTEKESEDVLKKEECNILKEVRIKSIWSTDQESIQ